MPLTEGYSRKSVSANIGREVAAGKDPKQAAAIAYNVARKAKRESGEDDEDQEESYLDVLQRAKEMENDAIAIGLKAMTLAPPEDLDRLAEITGDENDHDRIYTEILARYQTEEEGE